MWYLYALLEYYVLFSRTFIQKRIGTWWFLGIITVISILSIFSSYDWWFSFRKAVRDMLPFYVGILFNRYGTEKVVKNRRMWFLTALIIITRIFFYGHGIISNEIPVLSVVYGAVIAMWIFASFLRFKTFEGLEGLIIVGFYSMEMFIFQEYPLTIGTKILPRVVENAWVSLILCFAFTVLTVFLTTMIMKKIRLHDVFFKPYKQIMVKRRVLD